MNDFLNQIRSLSPQRLALLAVKLKEQLDDARRVNEEPIAVIGVGCRLPGAGSPDAFWDMLENGREGIREVPAARWPIDEYFDSDPDAPGMMSTRSGGFLDEIDKFDPAFFGIAPREAAAMDPQQRLLLEVSWEALENAGLAPTSLVGSRTGVYVGICSGDYLQLLLGRGASSIDVYLASGNAPSVASGRLSYVLGLQGPCMTIDTSCSASLVAIHSACQSLRLGESSLALAGGVNLICAPETTIALSKGHMLAGDGRCKTFDAAANGFARGEGCGIVVLKRLSDAKRDGDRVLALIRGSAINQDGKSSGLTVPNGPAQESVIRDALTAAGLEGSDIDYVEAHGTGTSLGDPIEVRSLARVLGEGRDPDKPLMIGSVKTNIGHLEAAAGVAGFLKVVLALQHEAIPKHLNFKDPNPFIEWENLPVAVASNAKPWLRGTRPRRAGVSSFGFSGTNAHLILEEAPADAAPVEGNDRPLHCLTVSARSEASLHELTRLYADALAPEKGPELADFAHVAATGRAHLTHRTAIVAADGAEAREALLAANSGAVDPRIRRGKLASGRSTEVVFLYTGAGAQYPGMARSLYQTSPVFRDAIDHCDKLLGPDAKGRTLKTVFWETTEGDPPIHDIGWTQPAMFAIEYALTTLWRSWGVVPAAVIGHSVGEYAAACAAGVFSVEDGLRLIAERGRLMQSLPPGGMMAALFAPIDEIEAAIALVRDRVAIAAINSPGSVVISGEASAVEAVLAYFAQRNVNAQRLFVSLAAHSPLMDPALDRMEALARGVAMSPPSIPIAWNLTGRPLPSGTAPDALYWRRHMREPVRFANGIKALHEDGFQIFLEVGPHPTLLAFAGESLPEAGNLFLTSLRRGKEDWNELLTSLADLHVHGVPVDFAGFDRSYARRRVTLPTYAFDRQRYWAAPTPRLRPDTGEISAMVDGMADAGALFYKVAWEPAASASAGRGTPSELVAETAKDVSYQAITVAAWPDKRRGWVVLGDGGGIGAALIAALEARGDRCVLQPTAGGNMDATAAQTLWRKWRGEGGEVPGVIDLRWLDCSPETSGASLQTHVNGSLSLVKVMVAETGGRLVRLWTVTRGAQAAGEVRNPLSPFAAAAWGLTWSAALEHPELCAVCVDLDPASVADEIAKLVFELDQDGREDKVVLRGGERLVARLRRRGHGASSNVLRPQELTSPLVRPDGQYVVTGGLSGLGLEVAEWLVEHGAKHISLIGRRGAATPGASAVLQRLAASGVEASVASIDVGDADALGAFLSERRIAGPPLRGVIHAAGILDDAALASQDWSRFERVIRPKVAGAQNLDRLTRADPLDWFVMFSSAAVLLGAPGQANYAAANMILDVMAHERRRLELPALSINWGPWAKIGMAASMEERMLASGLTPFTPKEGLGVMETIMRMDVAQVGVLAADWMQFLKRRDQDVSPPPYFARVMASRGRIETSGPAEKPAVVLRESLPPDIALWEKDVRRATLDRVVRRVVAEVVGLKSPQSIDAALSLFKVGLDSLMAIQLQRRLERATEETLPAAFAFNYPTLEAMVELLDSRIAARVPAAGDLDTSMDLLSRVDELSAEEIDSLLSQMTKESAP